jgi:solute carrier family 25 carnitine/acylcarnitine transporter 20/29
MAIQMVHLTQVTHSYAELPQVCLAESLWYHIFLSQAPLDHARFRVSLNKGHAIGSIGMATSIYRQYGIGKVFLGMNASILR